MEPKARVDACIVTYNSARHLGTMLPGLRSTEADIRLFVRDNASTDDTPRLLADIADAEVEHGANIGFAAAVNRITSRGDGEFILLLNPDCVMPAEVLTGLVDHLQSHPGSAAVAPVVLPADEARRVRALQGGWEPSLGGALSHALGVAGRLPRGGLYLHRRQLRQGRTTVDWVGGACVLIRRQALEEVGGFSERWFMYSEDIDLGRRLREAGWTVDVLGHLQVRHEQGGSIAAEDRRVIGSLWVVNLVDYYQWQNASSPLRTTAFRSLLAFGFGLRWLHLRLRGRSAPARPYAQWWSAALHS